MTPTTPAHHTAMTDDPVADAYTAIKAANATKAANITPTAESASEAALMVIRAAHHLGGKFAPSDWRQFALEALIQQLVTTEDIVRGPEAPAELLGAAWDSYQAVMCLWRKGPDSGLTPPR